MKLRRLVTAGFATLFAPALAVSHPHILAEARLEIVSDTKGEISELHIAWRFDELFSASVVLDFDKNSNATLDSNELRDVGQIVLESLDDYNYYTTIFDNGRLVKVKKPDGIAVDFKDNRLLMTIVVKPAETIPLKGKLSFGVYDPTMYTAMDFPSDEDLTVVGDKIAACRHKVVRPDPDKVLEENKDALTDDFWNDPAGTDMSKLFATRIEITCAMP
jgi:ABC-type uncharacterized transport system substrate-binding protein